MRFPRPSVRVSCAFLLAIAVSAADADTTAQIQRAVAGGGVTRRTTTVDALLTYPLFFHTQPVRVRGDLTGALDQTPWHLTTGSRDLLVMPSAAARGAAPPSAGGGKPPSVDILGVFLDVGRLQQSDPRATQDLVQLSQQRLKKDWPGVGELLVLVAETIEPAEALAAPSVRAVALDPERYAGQSVTVTGRFRGRNLFGDLPDAPGMSRWDFVIQSADAAIWVTGIRPRFDGRELNLERRIDTGRWVEVAGRVHEDRGLVRLEATDIRAGQAPAESDQGQPTTTAVQVPDKGPPPEVVFSAPTQDETDVAPSSPIRIQFSRDLDLSSIRGNVSVGYLGSPGSGAAAGLPTMTVKYDSGRRVMEMSFSQPLEPFRTVVVELKDGIKGTDGQPLVPWKLTFSVGGG